MTTHSQKAAFEEGCALSLLRELGDPPCPMDAFDLARRCRLRVVYGAPTRLAGDRIYVSRKLPVLEQHRRVAHELGHFCLHRYAVPDSEWGADWIGAALMLPRVAILRDARAVRGDLEALMRLHPNCSAELILYRLRALNWQGGRAA